MVRLNNRVRLGSSRSAHGMPSSNVGRFLLGPRLSSEEISFVNGEPGTGILSAMEISGQLLLASVGLDFVELSHPQVQGHDECNRDVHQLNLKYVVNSRTFIDLLRLWT